MFGIGSVCWFDMQDISSITLSALSWQVFSLFFTQTGAEGLRVCLLSVGRRPGQALLHRLPLLPPPPPPLPAAQEVRALHHLPACWPSSSEGEEMLGIIRAGIIQTAGGPGAARVVVVVGENISLHFCVFKLRSAIRSIW